MVKEMPTRTIWAAGLHVAFVLSGEVTLMRHSFAGYCAEDRATTAAVAHAA